jgi:hypothetical protein
VSFRQQTQELISPVAREYRRKGRRCWAYCAIAVYFLVIVIYWGAFAEVPVDYRHQSDHFKYGSIGSDSTNGIPYWIWRVLPEMFPDYLPDPAAFRSLAPDEQTGLAGYAQFGFVLEPGHDRPIGFSKRRDLVDRVGLNCSVCHTSTVRVTPGMDPARIYGPDAELRYAGSGRERVIVLGMPANTVDLQAYFQFLFHCVEDGRFTTDGVLAHVAARTKIGAKERLIYRRAIPEVRSTLLARRQQLDYFKRVPVFGPGRVDTFTPYKTIHFAFSYDGTVGTADFPSIWNQRPREGMQLHWDGNNKSVFERNISASLGAGVTPVSLDLPRMMRVARWIGSPEPDPDKVLSADEIRAVRTQSVPRGDELKIPKFPFAINEGLASDRGRPLYKKHCASCHDWNGETIGEVVPIESIQTDAHRLDSYTLELSANQNTFGAGQWWRFRNFRKTRGYANMPLDGLWARAPYLHNGSVPTLRDLLEKPADRPKKFYRGDDEYEPTRVGFRHDRDRSAEGRKLFAFKTDEPDGTPRRGNGNGGHAYGTELSDDEKQALVEYLKTL